MFKPKTIIALLAVLIALVAFGAPPVQAQDWGFCAAQGSAINVKLRDSLMCYGAAGGYAIWDTSKYFYFNGLSPKGSMYMKLVEKGALRDTLCLPRIEYQLISDDTRGNFTYGVNDSMKYTLYGPGDSSAVVIQKQLVWNREIAQKQWKLLVDSAQMVTWGAGDTMRRVLPYDFTQWNPIGVRFRMNIAGHATLCSTLVKDMFMTADKPAMYIKSR